MADNRVFNALAWLSCHSDGAWSIERFQNGLMRVEVMQPDKIVHTAETGPDNRPLVDQLDDCLLQLAHKIGIEA